jgi:hypothetical protein
VVRENSRASVPRRKNHADSRPDSWFLADRRSVEHENRGSVGYGRRQRQPPHLAPESEMVSESLNCASFNAPNNSSTRVVVPTADA